MKIALTLEKLNDASLVSDIFGRCNGFLIFNSISNSYEILKNPYSKVIGGAGIEFAKLLIENNIHILITKNIGINAFTMFHSADIEIFICPKIRALEAYDLFLNNKLKKAVINRIHNN